MRSENLRKIQNYTALKQFEQVANRTINKWQLRSGKFKTRKEKLRVKQIYKNKKGLRADKKLKLEDHI